MIVCGRQPGRYLERPPMLAIEVLSDSTAEKDRTVKRDLYEAQGGAHYLLVNPATGSIEWLSLGADGRYADRSGEIVTDGRFAASLPDGCRIAFDRQTTFA